MSKHPVFQMFDRPIAFHRSFVTLTGSVTAALMLSQAFYWTQRTKDKDGWFYKTQPEWEEETGLTRREQDTARRKLRQFDWWQEELRKANGAPTVHYRIDADKFYTAICTFCTNGSARNVQSDLRESAKSKCTNTPKPKTKTTTKNTTETTAEGLSADADARPPTEWQEFVGNLCWVCYGHKKVDSLTDAKKGQLTAEAARIRDLGYGTDQLRAWYRDVWQLDWRWQKNKQRPVPADVRSSIAAVEDSSPAGFDEVSRPRQSAGSDAVDRVFARLEQEGVFAHE